MHMKAARALEASKTKGAIILKRGEIYWGELSKPPHFVLGTLSDRDWEGKKLCREQSMWFIEVIGLSAIS